MSTSNSTSIFPPLSTPRRAFGAGSPAPTMKAMWIAIAVLSAGVLAIGATLIRQQPSAATGIVPLTGAQAMLAPKGLAQTGSMFTETKDGKPLPGHSSVTPDAKRAAAFSSSKAAAPTASSRVIAQNNAPAGTNSSVNASANICANCGTVEAVSPITRQGAATGVGMVGGAVVGGVLGNQVGKGNGRTAATVLGAVGGGWAGNTIEKNMNKTTAYSVRVRMQDGSSRVIEQSAAPSVGSKVTLDGNSIRPA